MVQEFKKWIRPYNLLIKRKKKGEESGSLLRRQKEKKTKRLSSIRTQTCMDLHPATVSACIRDRSTRAALPTLLSIWQRLLAVQTSDGPLKTTNTKLQEKITQKEEVEEQGKQDEEKDFLGSSKDSNGHNLSLDYVILSTFPGTVVCILMVEYI